MNNNLTEIVFIIDKSGSMYSLRMDAIGGYNSFIESQKKVEGEANVTLVLFDSSTRILSNGVSLQEAVLLNEKNYLPLGGTALYDAIGQTLTSVGNRLAKTSEDKRPSKVLVVITTDGEENGSVEFTKSKVFDMITHQKEKYNWEFIFLGATQDAMEEGFSIGIGNSVKYTADSNGTKSVYDAVSIATCSYRSVGLVSQDLGTDWLSAVK